MAKGKLGTKPQGDPFTLAHFEAWSRDLVLDTRAKWVLEDFQKWFIEDFFTGARECWFILPEGNGKTTLIAGLGLYHVEFTFEASVAVGASARDQAEILYRQASGFVKRSPALRSRFRCYDGYRRIVFGDDEDGLASKMQILAADEKTGDGVIPTLAIVDEPHRLPHMGLYRTWSGKLDKRDGQIIAISVAGEPESEFEVARENIRRAGGAIERTETFLRIRTPEVVYHEWSVPEKGDPEDLDLVKRANPFSAITIGKLAAKRRQPTMTFGHWLRMTCNRQSRGNDAAITEAEWFRAETPKRIPPGAPIWVGLDVGWKWDTTALVPLWTPSSRFRLFGPATVLVPPRDGNSLNPNEIKLALREILEKNPIHTLVMDTHKAEEIYHWAESELGIAVIDRGQSNVFAAMDYERFMEALRNDWLKHSGDPALTSHALNAVAHVLENKKIKFERPSQSRGGGDVRQATRVIDALAAGAMAHGVAAAEFDLGPGWGVA